MSLFGIASFLSEATCGEACWEAREDVCRCSCNGRNHGCLRAADGVRPERSAKLNGHRYVLKAVGNNLCGEAEAINQAAGVYYRYIESSRDAYTCIRDPLTGKADYNRHIVIPAKVRPATADQVARWPELAAYRDTPNRRPYLLWVHSPLEVKS